MFLKKLLVLFLMLKFLLRMSLLVLGDSNVERAWLSVRNNRELLRSAVFVPIKRIDQLAAGFQAMTSAVR